MTQHLSQEEEGDHGQHVEQLYEKSPTGGGGRSDVTKSLHSNSTLFFRSSRTSPFPSPIWTAGVGAARHRHREVPGPELGEVQEHQSRQRSHTTEDRGSILGKHTDGAQAQEIMQVQDDNEYPMFSQTEYLVSVPKDIPPSCSATRSLGWGRSRTTISP